MAGAYYNENDPYAAKWLRNQVLCRCGSRAGKGSGFVPSWFGDKCIEGDCPLRCIAKRKVA